MSISRSLSHSGREQYLQISQGLGRTHSLRIQTDMPALLSLKVHSSQEEFSRRPEIAQRPHMKPRFFLTLILALLLQRQLPTPEKDLTTNIGKKGNTGFLPPPLLPLPPGSPALTLMWVSMASAQRHDLQLICVKTKLSVPVQNLQRRQMPWRKRFFCFKATVCL